MAKSYYTRYNQRCDRGRGEEGGIFGAVTDDSTLKSHIRETEGERKRGKEKTIKPGPKPQAAKELERRGDPEQKPGTRQSAVQVGHFFGFPHLYYWSWESSRRVGCCRKKNKKKKHHE